MNILIGKAIRTIRKAKHLKLSYVAQQAGYKNMSTYSRLENGKIKHIDADKLNNIAKVFNCNTVHILIVAAIYHSELDIKTWKGFTASLNGLSNEDKIALEDIISKLF
ncbi:MAG: helix-turn-helix domain-containing protein [Bacteroidia bacterium]|nr:helix-turn-helix domain-containing protein [Bacteroidia bacterium]